MLRKTMAPRILQIHLRRWLHDRKLPEVKNDNKLPKLQKKIGVKSPKKESEIKIKSKVLKSNN